MRTGRGKKHAWREVVCRRAMRQQMMLSAVETLPRSAIWRSTSWNSRNSIISFCCSVRVSSSDVQSTNTIIQFFCVSATWHCFLFATRLISQITCGRPRVVLWPPAMPNATFAWHNLISFPSFYLDASQLFLANIFFLFRSIVSCSYRIVLGICRSHSMPKRNTSELKLPHNSSIYIYVSYI